MNFGVRRLVSTLIVGARLAAAAGNDLVAEKEPIRSVHRLNQRQRRKRARQANKRLS